MPRPNYRTGRYKIEIRDIKNNKIRLEKEEKNVVIEKNCKYNKTVINV